MTIENTLERIASALESLVTLQSAQFQAPQSPQQPQAPQTPQFQAPPTPQPQMPQAQYTPPQQPGVQAGQPAYPKSPFTDTNSVMAYCVEKYRALGPVKGGEIQTVLAALGHSNIATLRPDQYDEFYFRAESI